MKAIFFNRKDVFFIMLSKPELLAMLDNALKLELEEGVARYSAIIGLAPDSKTKKVLQKILKETKQHALDLVKLKFIVLGENKNEF